MARYLIATALVLSILAFVGATAQAQEVRDPFGDPFGADPFGGKAPTAEVTKKRASKRVANVAVPAKQIAAADKHLTVAERIEKALSAETTFTFVESPLQEALQLISRTHGIPIVVDRRALEEFGLTADTPVNLDLKAVSLRSFLRLMLRGLDLTYLIKDEVLQITTAEAKARYMVLKMHAFPPSLKGKAQQIVIALQKTVQPDAWDAKGGPATVEVVENVMAVRGNQDLHEDIQDFLVKLNEAYERSNAKK